MNRIVSVLASSAFAVALAAGAHAQYHNDHHDDHRDDHHDKRGTQHFDNSHYVRHNDWHKGYHMQPNDWNRGDRIDYRTYHLSAPPRGYEWRRVDGNYVMAAVATGVIASLVAASSVR